jgi:hypothetical protein
MKIVKESLMVNEKGNEDEKVEEKGIIIIRERERKKKD